MDRRASPALVAVLAILGFLLVAAASSADETRRAEAPRKARLIDLIESRRSQVGDLDAAVQQLRDQVSRAERDITQITSRDREAAAQIEALSAQAGTTAVRGPGLIVRLSDSDRKPSSTEDAGAFRIHDTDVQLVVNSLFAAGAEAVSVNGNRIVATTPIRSAGD